MALIYPLLTGVALWSGGIWIWIGFPLNLLLIPITDLWLEQSGWKPSGGLVRWSYSRMVLGILAAANWICLLEAIHQASNGLSAWNFFALASTVGIMTGSSALPAAHDLIHRRSVVDRGLGLVLLASASYMHFRIEHVYGHHRNLGTLDDPGTARTGEGFPNFFCRALAQGFLGAWRIERDRMKSGGVLARLFGNRMLHYTVIQLALYIAIYEVAGMPGAGFMLLQSLIAAHLLEAVNYIQHYGLAHQADGLGSRGNAPKLTRDSHSPLACLLLLGLPTHAEHHVDPSTPAEHLAVHPEAHLIPITFYWAVFIAIIPLAFWRLNRST